MKEVILTIGLILGFIQISHGQMGNIPLGKWKYHTSLNQANSVAVVGNKVYCGTSGGIFYLDKLTNKITKITRIEGLSGNAVTSIAYNASSNALVIGYDEGFIDIIQNDKIYNLKSIVNAKIIGSTNINDICFYQNTAYLSCDFGVVVVNVDKKEIKESYLSIGKNGTSPIIYASALTSDSIYLATSQGILGSKRTLIDLMNYQRWTPISFDINLASPIPKKITTFQNKLAIVYDTTVYYKKTIDYGKITGIKQTIRAIKTNDNSIYIGLPNSIKLWQNNSLTDIQTTIAGLNIKDFAPDAGQYWMADFSQGLVNYDGNKLQYYNTNTPINNGIFKIRNIENITYKFGGGYDKNTTPQGNWGAISVLEDGIWSGIYPSSSIYPEFRDAVDATEDKINNRTFFASVWSGIIVRDNSTNSVTLIDNNFKKCPLFNTGYGVRVTNTYFDSANNYLWATVVTGQLNYPTIHKIKPDLSCDSYAFPSQSTTFPMQILVDEGNNKWVRMLNSDGLMVFNDAKTVSGVPQFRQYRTGLGNGNLPTANVNCMVKDRSGALWLGTGKGIGIIATPGSVFFSSNWEVKQPIVDGFPLLFDQIVTTIDIDGANRKWIGTSNGLYLLSPDGLTVVHNFNTSNSPLPSNNILDVNINQKTGEVFIHTDKGLVSFRGDSTEGAKEEITTNMHIFPNPVSVNYTGTIGFMNLAEDAALKITDMSGQLVFQTKAKGGTATWNGRNYSGQRVTPGVYIVFSSTQEGNFGLAGKIFIEE
jgi:hypothetical protein